MIQWLFEIIGPIAKWQTDVLVAIIGLASAVVVASVGLFGSSLTILINKRNERKIDLRKIKEKQYIDFLSCLALAKISNENEIHENNLLLSCLNFLKCLLMGNIQQKNKIFYMRI